VAFDLAEGAQTAFQAEQNAWWAQAAVTSSTGVYKNEAWVQIGHAGRQTDASVNSSPLAPSAIKSTAGTPVAMSPEDIEEARKRMVFVAETAKTAGFTGCQVHAAHGYLLSSFLNPLANVRTDAYGGSLENRARLLLEVIADIRAAVGPDWPVSVKLNSSDFQKGGFSTKECAVLAGWLDAAGLDLLEISGGNYEAPAILRGPDWKESTAVREAYFLEFAADIKAAMPKTPLMVTGGFRSRDVMNAALQGGHCDVIGIGRPLCGGDLDCVNKLFRGDIDALPAYENSLDFSAPSSDGGADRNSGRKTGAQQAWYYRNEFRAANFEPTFLDTTSDYPRGCSLEDAVSWHRSNEESAAQALKGIDCSGTVYEGSKPVIRGFFSSMYKHGLARL
jgi:2,4-dienoyl-CoA reductase-like NADH-dependent reductase (Old Yellow Enzyme family)